MYILFMEENELNMRKNIQKNKETISVVMGTYNGERFIREQLDSILQQTVPADEIIIQDDCSTDHTYDILLEYTQKYPIIKLYRNSKNLGVNANFFNAISKAQGDFIAISDQDDIWNKNKLELQIKSIGKNLLCGGRSVPFSTGTGVARIDMRIPNFNLIRWLFIGSISGHTMMLSRELLNKMPNVSSITPYRFYDAILGMTAASFNSIVYLEEELVKHRRHIDAASYHKPTDNRMSVRNICRNIIRTWKFHKTLKPEISRRLKVTHCFLQAIDSKEQVREDALRMIELYTGKSFFDWLSLEIFCIKHYNQLFYSKVNLITGILRAIYFPVSLSEYYRYLLPKKQL